MAFDKLTATQLQDALEGGLINEDVMQTIMNENREIDLELTTAIPTESHSNSFTEWTLDRIAAPATNIKLIDGQDISDNNSTYGKRVGNHTQTAGGRIVVSYEAEESDTIGRASELGYQTSKYSLYLERSVQNQIYGNLASIEGNGDTIAAQSAGLEAQIGGEILVPGTITTNSAWTTTKLGTADCTVQQCQSAGTITGGGLNNMSSGIIPAWTYTGVTPGALTETKLRNAVQAAWNNSGKKTTFLGLNRGAVNRIWSEYSFSSTARIATKIDQAAEGDRTPREGMGATNVFITDFGIIKFMPENIMPQADTGSSSDTLFLLNAADVALSYMWNYRGERQAKTGLSDKWQLSVAYALKVLNPSTQGMVQGIDATAAMTY